MTRKEKAEFLKETKNNGIKMQRLLDALSIDGFAELDKFERRYLKNKTTTDRKELKKVYFTPIEKALKNGHKMAKANEELTILLGVYAEKIEALENFCEVIDSFIDEKGLFQEFIKYSKKYSKEKKSEDGYIEA